jgi:site-specific DNA-cytosine methylase
MNVLSLFDGISCGQIALQRAGIKVDNYYASEIDKHAIKATQYNWPNSIQLGSVIDVKAENLPKINLLIGGSPCQSFSFSGKQNGMSTIDKQDVLTLEQYLQLKSENFQFEGYSYLFWEYVRLLKEANPTHFLLENVKMSKKWERVISTALEVEPIEINSRLVSAQNRRRLYWTNIQGITQPEDMGQKLIDVLDSSVIGDKNWFDKRASLKRRNVIQSIRDEKSACLQTQAVFNSLLKELCRYLTPEESEKLQTLPNNYTKMIPKTARYKAIGNGWTVDVIAHIFKNIPQA